MHTPFFNQLGRIKDIKACKSMKLSRALSVTDRWVSVDRTAWFVRKPGMDVPDSLGVVLENAPSVLDSKLVFGVGIYDELSKFILPFTPSL
jgi:hypothetical protein